MLGKPKNIGTLKKPFWICGGNHLKKFCPNRKKKSEEDDDIRTIAFVGIAYTEEFNSGCILLFAEPLKLDNADKDDDDSMLDLEERRNEEPDDDSDATLPPLEEQEDDGDNKELRQVLLNAA